MINTDVSGRRMFAWLLGFFLAGPALAQFYAPDTEYHDPVQRMYVVEAARALAWWYDPAGAKIAEIKFAVTTKPDGSTEWDLEWLDSGGKNAKRATVSYGPELLKEGPKFYRTIFEKLWHVNWDNPPRMKAEDLTRGFWRGAGRAGVAREKSLAAAFKVTGPAPAKSNTEWIPELAGLLAHTTLPGLAANVTLDRVLLARAAAWLAFSEWLAGKEQDALWAPVLFQAGREITAAQLWQKGTPAKMTSGTVAQQAWNLWLRRPASRDVFLFACERTNLVMGMPMLVYDARTSELGGMVAEFLPKMAGSAVDLQEFHNYAPFFQVGSGVGAGHLMNGGWAVFSRKAWQELMMVYVPGTNDYNGYKQPLLKWQKTKVTVDNPQTDLCLAGFRDAVPMLQIAREEGVGKLTPTAVATARDLLNFGWEMNGWQMGSRYVFVARTWGVTEQAVPIFDTVTSELEGYMPFFWRKTSAYANSYDPALTRLQHIAGFYHLVGYSEPPQVGDSKEASVEGWVRRCWLRYPDFEWLARSLSGAKLRPKIPELIDAMRAEGGRTAGAFILEYLNSLNTAALTELPWAAKYKESIAEEMPTASMLRIRALTPSKYNQMGNFDRAQEYEKLYWENPESGLEQRIFQNYIHSGAFESARRFYYQARENFLDPVKTSRTVGVDAYIVGVVLNDAKLRRAALEDSECASYYDMMMNIWDSALKDNQEELAARVEGLVDRYESDQGANSQGNFLLGFLELLPALKDPRHASRQEALGYFGKSTAWLSLRFIWAEKYNLPIADAIKLLGGRENTVFVQFLIACLEKDQPKALKLYNQLGRENTLDYQRLQASCLYSRMHPLGPERVEKDLKPEGAVSIREEVQRKLSRVSI